MKHNFKEGDEVEILSTANTRSWSSMKHPFIGAIVKLNHSDAASFNIIGYAQHINNNVYGVNFDKEDFKLVSTKEPIYEIY